MGSLELLVTLAVMVYLADQALKDCQVVAEMMADLAHLGRLVLRDCLVNLVSPVSMVHHLRLAGLVQRGNLGH